MEHRHIAKRHWKQGAELALDSAALARYDDVIDLSVGDTDFITDSRIIDAAFRDARAGYTKYGDPKGDAELIEAVCRYYQEEYALPVTPAEVLVTTSSCFGMELALLAILNPGDEVILFSPYFSPYKAQVELAGGVAAEVATREETGFAITEEALRAALTEKTRAILFNNPCNPTGAAYGEDTLRMIAAVAQERDLVVIADEIYTHYLFDGTYLPLRALTGMAERTVTLNSFSKNYMMTGWRIGCAVAAPHFVNAMLRINNSMVYTAPSLSQRAALEALKIRKSVKELYINEYKKRVYYAAERIAAIPWLTLCKPRGAFYLFPGIGKTGLSSSEFCARLFERAHVLTAPGNLFGGAGEGHFRIACTVDVPKLAEAFDRMERMELP